MESGTRGSGASAGTWKALSIVVPVFHNAESLRELAGQLHWLELELRQRHISLELIFVDDGSQDHSFSELLRIKAARPNTKVIRLTRNFGAVAASKAGYQYVTGDAFMPLSADLQEPIVQILHMCDEWIQGSKFVISARARRRDPIATRIFAGLYYRLLDLMVIKHYPAGGADLMLMDAAMLPYLQRSAKSTNPNVYAFWLGFKPAILYYERGARRHGRSRWTFRKKMRLMLDTLTGFSIAPLRLLSGVGFSVALGSVIYGCNIAISALVGDVPVQGFATLAVLVSFFSGLILVMLGILAEYLWRVVEAVNGRPESVVQDEHL